MTLLDSINRAHALVQQLTSQNTDVEMRNILIDLDKELSTIKSSAEQAQTSISPNQTPAKLKSGCYIFNDDKRYYCPLCFDNNGTKVPTKRMNSQLRVCPTCHASIK